MSLEKNINSLVKIKKIKKGLSVLPTKKTIDSTRGVRPDYAQDENGALKGPLTLNILTYDNAADVEIEDTSAVTHTLKTAATAEIIDANGNTYTIDTITFAAP